MGYVRASKHMIGWENIKEIPERPYYIARKLNRIYHRRGGMRSHNPKGILWLDQDWDILTILDACRFDVFEHMHELPGELSSIESIGCSTAPVFRGNLDKKKLDDTVFVSAHPAVYNGQRDQLIQREPIRVKFHDQIDVWKKDGWDEQAQTVLPETMYQYVRDAADEYPNKRLMIHFLQPHCPFIGDTGQEHYNPEKRNFWGDVMTGRTDREHLWEAYRENLAAVLPTVQRIMYNIEGKHVVTGGHGQFLGERAYPIPNKEYGHPRGIYQPPVLNVPWLEWINQQRREIKTETSAIDSTSPDNEALREKLGHLGYVNE